MSEMLADAVILMVIGMVSVFLFLILLTGCVTLLTRLTAETVAATPSVKPTVANTGQPDAAQMAAIASAITQYRNARSRS